MRPLLATCAGAVAALVVVALGHWRIGGMLLGLVLCAAAAARLVLPAQRVGDLAVRSRAVDAAVLLLIGFGLVGLANTIPGH